MDQNIKQWDWVRFAGVVWRVAFIENGWVTICNETQKKRVDVSVLERIDISDKDFSDPYPYE